MTTTTPISGHLSAPLPGQLLRSTRASVPLSGAGGKKKSFPTSLTTTPVSYTKLVHCATCRPSRLMDHLAHVPVRLGTSPLCASHVRMHLLRFGHLTYAPQALKTCKSGSALA